MIVEITADQLWRLAKDGLVSIDLMNLSEQYILSIGEPTCNAIRWDGEAYYVKVVTHVFSEEHTDDPYFPDRTWHGYAGINKWIVPELPPPVELLQVAVNYGTTKVTNDQN